MSILDCFFISLGYWWRNLYFTMAVFFILNFIGSKYLKLLSKFKKHVDILLNVLNIFKYQSL